MSPPEAVGWVSAWGGVREREGGGWTPPAGEGQRGSISVWRFDREARGVLNADPIVCMRKEIGWMRWYI